MTLTLTRPRMAATWSNGHDTTWRHEASPTASAGIFDD